MKFKVGDEVYCTFYNKRGTVVSIDPDIKLSAINGPVKVKLIYGHGVDTYGLDGKYNIAGIVRLRLVTKLEKAMK